MKIYPIFLLIFGFACQSQENKANDTAKTSDTLAQASTKKNTPMTNKNPFEVNLTSEKSSYKTGDEIQLKFTVSNRSSQSAKFCKWHTPFEGIRNNFLAILLDGNKLDYQGIMAKRSKPDKDDYLELASGKSTSVVFSISKEYEFSKAGKYSVQFKGNESINQLPDSEVITIDLK